MPLRIRVLDASGAIAAQFEFPDSQAMITVGRHPTCDVVFPADQIVVSRFHLGLERKLARYRLVMQSDNPVQVDGEDAFEGDELPLAAEIHLGTGAGPILQVETIEDDALPVTRRYARQDSPARMAAQVIGVSRRIKVLTTTAMLALAVFTIGFFWVRHVDRAEMSRLVSESLVGSELQSADLLVKALRSAQTSLYVVALRDQYGMTPLGTAFVVRTGALATSAHVAEVFNTLEDGLQMVLIGPGNSTPIPVSSISMHPHYRLFDEAWRGYGPLMAGTAGESRPIAAAGGYDVALLHVDRPHASKLGQALTFAPMGDLRALDSGDVVGYVGFPVESAALGGVNLDDPEAQLQIGHMTALSDFFLVKSDPAERYLLQHSLPVQGGASGSPLLDRRGHVVGVVSGGNLVEIDEAGTRVPTGVGVNFAQRIDLVTEMLDGSADMRTKEREALWKRRLDKYQSEVDLVLTDWAASHGAATSPKPKITLSGVIGYNSRLDMDAWDKVISLPEDGYYLFLGLAAGRENIDMVLIEDVLPAPQVVGTDTAPDHYPSVEFAGRKGSELRVILRGEPGVKVELKIYALPFDP